ncbi:MAG: DoxX family protein [Pirellulales bacterium]|nr:DoxX family protein [Pirellulales bacterium]
MSSKFQIGCLGAALLVILRIAIGWHFLYQGLWKLNNPDFDSSGFLSQAKGPLADYYYGLIPDYWGRERLDRERALARITDYRRQFGEQHQLSEDQKSLADRIAAARSETVGGFFDDNKEAIATYLHELDRWTATRADEAARGLEYQQKRLWDKQRELQAKVKPWVTELDGGMEQLRTDLNGVLTTEQRASAMAPELSRHQRMDKFITYSNIAVGVCLILGLFTRLAALGGGLFLLTIVLSQPEWPGIYPPAPPAAGRSLGVTKEVVEMVAMFVLAALPVGRWGGLDFFLHNLVFGPMLRRRRVREAKAVLARGGAPAGAGS